MRSTRCARSTCSLSEMCIRDSPDFRPLAEQAGMVVHKGSSFRHLAVQSHVDIKGIRLAPPHDHLGEEDVYKRQVFSCFIYFLYIFHIF